MLPHLPPPSPCAGCRAPSPIPPEVWQECCKPASDAPGCAPPSPLSSTTSPGTASVGARSPKKGNSRVEGGDEVPTEFLRYAPLPRPVPNPDGTTR
eukprot:683772-Rhodomonas_salina.2